MLTEASVVRCLLQTFEFIAVQKFDTYTWVFEDVLGRLEVSCVHLQ